MTWITIGEGGYPFFMQGGGDEIAEVPVTDEPTEFATEVATQVPVATVDPLATESPVVAPQVSCTPVLDDTGLQNGSMGTPEPQNGTNEQQQLQDGNGNNQPDAPAEPQQNGSESGSGQQNGGQP